MRRVALTLACCALGWSCAGQSASRSSETVFSTPAAEHARERAPDLYQRAEAAWSRAEQVKGRKDEAIAESNLRTSKNMLRHASRMRERGYVSDRCLQIWLGRSCYLQPVPAILPKYLG